MHRLIPHSRLELVDDGHLFRLLRILIARPGRVFSRDQLLDVIYPDHRVVADRTIDSHVRNLRRKLATAADVDPIRSVYGIGYSFEWPRVVAPRQGEQPL